MQALTYMYTAVLCVIYLSLVLYFYSMINDYRIIFTATSFDVLLNIVCHTLTIFTHQMNWTIDNTDNI